MIKFTRALCLVILLPFLTTVVWACNNTLIAGSVFDQCTGVGIAAARVATEQAGGCAAAAERVLTFKNGQFGFSLAPGDYVVVASKAGYQEQRQRIVVTDNEQTALNFYLLPENACTPVSKPLTLEQAVAIYEDVSGQLSIKDVRIGDEPPMSAELQNLGDYRFKVLQITPLTGATSASPAFYNFANAVLEIPRVYAYKQLFNLKMRYVGEHVFQLDNASVNVVLE